MTKAERERLSRLKEMPCIVCGRRPVEIHHLVDNGYRRLSGGHSSTIPLCIWHHRGEPDYWQSKKSMAQSHGPSLATSKRAFVERFGSERELLAKVNALLDRAGLSDTHYDLPAPNADNSTHMANRRSE